MWVSDGGRGGVRVGVGWGACAADYHMISYVVHIISLFGRARTGCANLFTYYIRVVCMISVFWVMDRIQLGLFSLNCEHRLKRGGGGADLG